jgi:thioesterase domain-containing protein
MEAAAALQRTLHAEIPISQAMGIRVAGYDGRCLRLAAPLAPNINHKLTAFGGSLYSVAVLCGWGLLHLKLAESGLHKHIVIQESNIRYLRPVDQEMQAECCADEGELGRFFKALEKHGRARIALAVTLRTDDRVAVEFSGRYVVHG